MAKMAKSKDEKDSFDSVIINQTLVIYEKRLINLGQQLKVAESY